tara:strand:+ start:248 stop:481 length:234 start_codon:yes stop_codon:yes gene_type:complete
MSEKGKEVPLDKNPREKNKVDLKEKLRNKIRQKKMGRMNTVQRTNEFDGYIKKMGISNSDMHTLKELSEKIIKNKTK